MNQCMTIHGLLSSITLILLTAGALPSFAAGEKKELNCVVFADFQNPEDQGYLSSEKVHNMKECQQLAEKWTELRCIRYGGFGYFQTIILDDTQSVKDDVVRGPTLKQCPSQTSPAIAQAQ